MPLVAARTPCFSEPCWCHQLTPPLLSAASLASHDHYKAKMRLIRGRPAHSVPSARGGRRFQTEWTAAVNANTDWLGRRNGAPGHNGGGVTRACGGAAPAAPHACAGCLRKQQLVGLAAAACSCSTPDWAQHAANRPQAHSINTNQQSPSVSLPTSIASAHEPRSCSRARRSSTTGRHARVCRLSTTTAHPCQHAHAAGTSALLPHSSAPAAAAVGRPHLVTPAAGRVAAPSGCC